MLRGIQWRIAVPFFLIILVGMTALGIYLSRTVSQDQITNLQQQLRDQATIIAEASLPYFNTTDSGTGLDALAKRLGNKTTTRVTLIAADGSVLGDSERDPQAMENHATRPEVSQALATGNGVSTRYSTTLGEDMLYVAVTIVQDEAILGFARVAVPLTEVEALVNRVTLTIALATLFTALLVAAAAWLVTRASTRPIRAVTHAARRIAAGELEQKILVSGSEEVERLARAFNEMAASLEETVRIIADDRAKMSSVLGHMADGVMMTDEQGTVLLANRSAADIFNFDEAAAIGRPLIELVPDVEIDKAVKNLYETGREQILHLESGVSKRFLRAILVPVPHDGKQDMLLLIQDLTELRSLQTMRRELVGNISHEFRTPLAGIKAMAETLHDGAIDDPATARDFLNRIDDEVDRLTQMVSELTELSRIEMGRTELNLQPLDINQLAGEVVMQLQPQATRKQIDLKLDPATDLSAILADRERIRQVIVNLVHNAVKFTPDGGQVSVITSATADGISLSVRDNGPGIDAENLPHVFERFYKVDRARSGGGSGMGLAIAKHVIEAHGGQTTAQSQPGVGATFSFTLTTTPE